MLDIHGDCGAGEHGRPSAAGTARDLAFLHRYDRLLGLARRLAWRSRDSSADLVHDAFIQFARGCADVGAIADLDRYLATTLKNVHLAQLRRAARAKHAAGIPATLVAELVKAGCGYLSDEYAVLDSHGACHAYPRRLSLRMAGRIETRTAEELGGRKAYAATRLNWSMRCSRDGLRSPTT